MKKYLITYFALAALMVISFSSCGSDNEPSGGGNTPVQPVNPPTPDDPVTPPEVDKALQYELKQLLAGKQSDNTDISISLKSFEITEDNKILIECIDADNKPLFIFESVSISNGAYNLNGSKGKGTIKVSGGQALQTKGSESVTLDINLTLSLSSSLNPQFISSEVEANQISTGDITDNVMKQLVNTWIVRGVILDLKRIDPKMTVYEEFPSHNDLFYLEDVLEEALEREVKLTDDEQEDMKRVIKYICVTKSNKFVIAYVDGTEDVAAFSWADSQKTQFTLNFLSDYMGNKFINSDIKGTVAFKDNLCNIKLSASFVDNDNKNWDSTLLFQLKKAN